MPYEFQHCHYTAHLDNPDLPDKLALFKVIKDGDLVAVIRKPVPEALIATMKALTGTEYRDSTMNHRVDCRVADDDLKAAIAKYLPKEWKFDYFADAAWTWKDNGTYQTMPWPAQV
jgi:hypothetical protein